MTKTVLWNPGERCSHTRYCFSHRYDHQRLKNTHLCSDILKTSLPQGPGNAQSMFIIVLFVFLPQRLIILIFA